MVKQLSTRAFAIICEGVAATRGFMVALKQHFVYVMFMNSSHFIPRRPQETTSLLTRGVCRLFQQLGFGTLTEFRLSNGRRVDVMAMHPSGEFVIIEIKSTIADYRADKKWHEYIPFCERFYFAVPSEFPIALVPDDCGVIMADSFDAVVRRESSSKALNSNRKRHQLINFALTASWRLGQIEFRQT